ncbi:hypothetical protein [Cerasicoccus maritimus]|uniref:hypothetical protein n=1 Tax=Cerasicoccus maritimus TaxID=490089 RepID=UPI0028525DBC|nr:hypothetical protein [Cerasicoccus maritimus]
MKSVYPITTLALGAALSTHAAVFNVTGDPSDRGIGLNDSLAPVFRSVTQTNLSLANDNFQFNQGDLVGVLVFELPDLGGQAISTANLYTQLTNGGYLQPDGGYPYDIAIYGMRTSASNAVELTDYGFGTSPGNGDLIQSDYYTFTTNQPFPGDEAVNTSAAGSISLASWLQDQYDGGATAGDYAFIRLTPSGPTNNPPAFASADNTTPGYAPVLTVETIPEPRTYAAIAGLGMLTLAILRRRH